MEQTQQPYNASADAIKAAKIEAEIELFKADARKREAEITKMIEDSIKDRERYRIESEKDLERYRAESERALERQRAEFAKMAAERAKIERETAWYPLIAMASAMGAGAAIMAGAVLLLKYITTS